MPGIVVRLELSLELFVRFCVTARHCGPTGTKSGASCEVFFFLESRQYQISPNLPSRSRADTCGQTDGHD